MSSRIPHLAEKAIDDEAEVNQFERSASITRADDIPNYFPGQFIQNVADNVDHNIRSLDGKDTFHGMCIIATSPHARKRKTYRGTKSICINQRDHSSRTRQYSAFDGNKCNLCAMNHWARRTANIDVLWKISLNVRLPRPAWSIGEIILENHQ